MKIYLSTAALALLGGAASGWSTPWAQSSLQAAASDATAPELNWEEDAEISARLARALRESGAPGAIGAVVQLGKRTRIGSYGVRCAGKEAPMTSADLVHIGSDTKAMTAVLIARLVQQGKMGWDSTIHELLPATSKLIHKDFRPVTVRQLLLHQSGLPANAEDWWAFQGKNVRQRRVLIAQAAMAKAPATKPGEAFLYSNLGVMVAGAMAEAACDATWEQLIREHVFEPLGMASAAFGVPGTAGEVDQPWGHTGGDGGKFVPVQLDNDPALGPAGTVHLSMADWAKFATVFLEGVGSEQADPFLSAESMGVLVGAGTDSAHGMGWLRADRSWAGGTALTHSGSNTTWYANAWVAPEVDLAFLVAVNAYGRMIPAAADAFIGESVMAAGQEESREGR